MKTQRAGPYESSTLRRCGFFPAAARTYAGYSRCPACEPLPLPAPGSDVFRNIRNAPGEPTVARRAALRVCRNSSCSYGAPCATRQAMPMLEVAALRLFPGLPRNLRVLVGSEPDKHRPDQVETCSSQRPSSTLSGHWTYSKADSQRTKPVGTKSRKHAPHAR